MGSDGFGALRRERARASTSGPGHPQVAGADCRRDDILASIGTVDPLTTTAIVAACVACGVPAGAAARLLLARMRRGARVPPLWCETAVGLLWGLTGLSWGVGALAGRWLPVLLGLGWLAVAGTAVDVLVHRLPDALTGPALPAAVLLLIPLGTAALLRAVAGAAVLLAAYAVVHLTVPEALGAGDVKLAATLGAVLAAVSWPALLLGALGATVLTGLVAAVGLGCGRIGRGAAVPHGPAMLAAGWLVMAGSGLAPGLG
ncbi:prepilin peptidase [Pseudonocardia hispaniensis]|uniref:Prepilin peptidase n=1 Tax=Pseudonocardia hispaniensis TaxID=904933 RepID=A0ABW1J125_9PSEU